MKAILFDMYGVIMKDPHGNLMPYLRRHFPDCGREGVYALWSALEANRIGHEDFWRGIGFGDDWRAVEEDYLASIEIDPAFHAVAPTLRETCRLALLSDDVAAWSARLRERHGLNRRFDAVVVSGEAGVSKPDPAIFERALAALGLPGGDCLLIDDSAANLLAARALGLETVHFNSRGEPESGDAAYDYGGMTALLRMKGWIP